MALDDNISTSGFNHSQDPTTASGDKSGLGDRPSLSASPAVTAPAPRLNARQWLQILSTSIAFFNTWGILLTSGAFQTYYEETPLQDYSSSTISWISTTCAFVTLAVGIITGPLYDQGFYRLLLLFGSLLQVFGLMMLSLSTKYYEIFLSHSICTGLGAGILFTPSLAAAGAALPNVSTRTKAMGLVACVSSIGGVIYPITFQRLVPQIGFPWTVRTIGFIMLALYFISYSVLIGHQQKPATVWRLFDVSALTDLPYMILCVSAILSAMVYLIPLLYIPLSAKVSVPSISSDLASNLLPIMNGASAIGRIIAGVAGAKFGATETFSVSIVLSSIVLFCWIPVGTTAGIIVWSVFWGMISGFIVALPGAFIPLFCPMEVIGTRSGMFWILFGVGLLIGSPIAGVIYDVRSGGRDLWHLQVFAGVILMGSAILMVYPIVHLHRKAQA
ncbi:putative MFS monocarboxylate transporter [Rostrohypoxylon terebratum]|nr:putative MFS monocarboxylate transporter [Rostrohypoxylon terebratum]